jgi:hypothetical protein
MAKETTSPKRDGKEKFGVPSYVPPNRDKKLTPVKPATPKPTTTTPKKNN